MNKRDLLKSALALTVAPTAAIRGAVPAKAKTPEPAYCFDSRNGELVWAQPKGGGFTHQDKQHYAAVAAHLKPETTRLAA